MVGKQAVVKTNDGFVYQGVVGDVWGNKLSLFTLGLLVRSGLAPDVIEELEGKSRIVDRGYGCIQFTVSEISEIWLMRISLES